MTQPLPLVLLAGNPNSGKTSLFNALTGSRYKVANYPGVTVEQKRGYLRGKKSSQIILSDLPGIYNLFGSSLDEQIAVRSLTDPFERQPNLVVAVVDATHLERGLYLVSQLIDLGVPVVLAITMVDLAEKQGIEIRSEVLARSLDLPVVLIHHSRRPEALLKEIELCLSQEPKVSSQRFAWAQPAPEFLESCRRISRAAPGTSGCPELHGAALIAKVAVSTSPDLDSTLEDERTRLAELGIDPDITEANLRYRWLNAIVKRAVRFPSFAPKSILGVIDSLTTHHIFGPLIFLVLMGLLFQAIFQWATYPMELIDQGVAYLQWSTSRLLPEGSLNSLVTDGVLAGVGSVIIFIPQIAVLFFLLGLLEESGYLTRAAFVTDGALRKVGLQGRAFVPLLSSFACAIPGILSTRTIPTVKERLITILIAPLMSCSARLPVYTLLIAAFIPKLTIAGVLSLQGLVLFSLYLLGVIVAVFVALILKLLLRQKEVSLFMMEMPSFRRPSARVVLRQTLDRVLLFMRSAGTVILACSVVLWFLASHPKGPIEESYVGRLGHVIEPAIRPLGFNWEIGIGLITSFAAREVFVSTLATVYHLQQEESTKDSLVELLRAKREGGSFSVPTALSLMVFYVFACQCVSTLAVCRKETNSWTWPAVMFVYMTTLAYVLSFVTYQISGRLLS